jgi:uncharacterized membrane protein YdjX (TVP38/TMEM64 family)
MKDTEAKKENWVKPVVLVGVLVAVVVALKQFGVMEYFSKDNIQALNEKVESLGWLGPVLYIGIYIAGCLFFLPGLALTLVSGIFGSLWGTVYVSIGSTIGAALAFLLARTAMRPMVEGWAQENKIFKKIDNGVEEHGWRMVMITRLVPFFPFNFQNYAYGLTKVPFWTYVLVSWICMLPGTAAYVIASGSIISGEGDVKKTLGILAVAAVIFVGLSFIPSLIKKRYALADAGA